MNHKSYITKEHLDSFGVVLGSEDETSLLAHLNDTLKERIGTEIAAMIDDAKLQELLTLQTNGDEEDVERWLVTNVPELQQIVEDEIDILLSEVVSSSDTINKIAEK